MSHSYAYLFLSGSLRRGELRDYAGGPAGGPGGDDKAHTRSRHAWGSYSCWSSARNPMLTHRLVVYPPGISPQQRRRLRQWRSWPEVSLIAAFAALLCALSPQTRPIAGAIVLAFVLCYVNFAKRSERDRRLVREIAAIDYGPYSDVDQRARCAEVRAMYEQLVAADLGLAQGVLTPADHEAVWHDVYNRVDAQLAHR